MHAGAAGFGCHAELVERIEALAPALRRALTSGRPACINVMVDRGAVPPDAEALIAGMKARLIGDWSAAIKRRRPLQKSNNPQQL